MFNYSVIVSFHATESKIGPQALVVINIPSTVPFLLSSLLDEYATKYAFDRKKLSATVVHSIEYPFK